MSAPVTNSVVPTPSTLDIDAIINRWAAERLGGDVEKIDASNIHVQQMSVLYQSSEDWFRIRKSHEEIFDSSGSDASSWQYTESIKFPSSVTWTIEKGFKSSILPKAKLTIEYPIAEDGHAALKGVFEEWPVGKSVVAKTDSVWDVKDNINVKPYSTTRVTANVRTCRLKDVLFSTDIQLSGVIHISGKSTANSKKSKSGKHVEVSGSIEEALASCSEFKLVDASSSSPDAKPDTYEESQRKVCFRLEGRCTGEVGLGVQIKQEDVQSLV